MAKTREASHAGSWYSSDEERLSLELDRWLDEVPDSVRGIGPISSQNPPVDIPSTGSRVIIAPHAGYSYSGRAAGWAYKALNLSQAKRIFILGPSHHFYMTRCALSQCETYETPFGHLNLDLDTISELHRTGQFDRMSLSVDEAEHSIEMHLPYIYKTLVRTFSDYATELPPIIPILVGNTSPQSEAEYGRLLAPYLADPSSAFVVSSDFAHWGSRFRYTYYCPSPSSGLPPRELRSNDKSPTDPKIFESIAAVDLECIGAVESGAHENFLDVLSRTGNTVCGRHPIGIIMAALQVLRAEGKLQRQAGAEQRNSAPSDGRFHFIKYERSGDCINVKDSSVSYASGFAVL